VRIAIFFDGKNFYSGWRATAEGLVVDFVKLSQWLVRKAGGSRLWGAYYYTGIETGEAASHESQRRLVTFLDQLEFLPGFFVHRFPRKARQRRCEKCGDIARYTQEKEVDTTMVADMLRLAAVDAFDAAVLVSGDSDHAPAVEGVRTLGKQVYVATWGKEGLSPRTRKAAFDHIDLKDGLAVFVSTPQSVDSPRPIAPVQSVAIQTAMPDVPIKPTRGDGSEDAETAFLQELACAESRFKGGYVGVNYFLKKWKSRRLSEGFQARNRILQKLLGKGRIETFDALDGKKALRAKTASPANHVPTIPDVSSTTAAQGNTGQPPAN
jgi:uncharacterized LabA/DUF88 family protein